MKKEIIKYLKKAFKPNKKFICFVLFCFTLLLTMNSTRVVFLGLHNMDLSYNFIVTAEYIEEEYNIELPNINAIGDETNNGYKTYEQLYSIGFKQIMGGFLTLFLAMLLFGLSIYALLSSL